MNLYSRKVIGWQLQDHILEKLVTAAFRKSFGNRDTGKGLIVHSDRGGQYVGKGFRKMRQSRILLQSMSRKDNPYANAFMKSYFSCFNTELLQDGAFDSLEDSQTEIFESI